MTAVVVAAAVVDAGAGRSGAPRLLAAQRSRPPELAGWWELPGGKVEAGEDETSALVRECREELGVELVVEERVGPEVVTIGGDAVLRVWWARLAAGSPAPVAHEHAALRWLSARELDDVQWLPADLPVVEAVAAGLAARR